MNIELFLSKNNISKYQLAKISGVSKTTIVELCSEKTALNKCNAETVYKLAKALNVSMEKLLAPSCEPRCSFELFKSNVCHELKALGDLPFIKKVLVSDDISLYSERGWYPESLYLLAIVDYLSRIHEIPLCSKYNSLRRLKLERPIYPSGVIAISAVEANDRMKKKAYDSAIPEFRRHNIIEVEVRDVI